MISLGAILPTMNTKGKRPNILIMEFHLHGNCGHSDDGITLVEIVLRLFINHHNALQKYLPSVGLTIGCHGKCVI